MCNGTWYNPTILSHLYGYSFEKYFNTGIKDTYYLMCAIDAHNKRHPPKVPDRAISGVVSHFSITLSTQSLLSLG